MEKDETIQEDELVEETVEDVVSEDETEEETEEESPGSDDEVAELKKRNAILQRKLKKATKPNEEPKKETQTAESLSREEAKLYAKGLEDDEVDRVIKIAKLDGVSLTEAYQSEDFKLYKEKKDREAKRAAAQLGAARGGSANAGQSKDFNTPGLTEDDHKKLWKKSVGR